MGHTNKCMEDSGTEGYMNIGKQAKNDSEEKNISILSKESSCDILAKNGCLLPLSKKLPEAKLKLWINKFGIENFQTAYY